LVPGARRRTGARRFDRRQLVRARRAADVDQRSRDRDAGGRAHLRQLQPARFLLCGAPRPRHRLDASDERDHPAAAAEPDVRAHRDLAPLLAPRELSPPRVPSVETFTPPGTPTPIGPYNHIAKVGPFITIGGTAGFDPSTGALAGADVGAQTRRI